MGLDQHGKVVLHVGHIKRNRGLDCFKSLKSEGYTCLIVGSPDFSNETLSMELRKNGIRIITKYIPNIEEYYMASDCFLFPLMDLPMHSFPTKYNQMGVIDTPLSVLEAVSCGISVVTTDYGGLKKVLGERKGIVFWDGSPASLSDCLRDSMGNKPDESTVPDWDSVATGILNAYSEASFGL
ncbi:MAG: glycosyltransferase family 4 protein [Acidobacteria bacterium]|nr:glycosyltransferase family 4 protein [Acidobacteriota bacterium]